MKKFLILLFLLIVSSFSFVHYSHAESLAERLKGTILLQVESNGEAWYVDPVTLQRAYLKDGNVAYNALREFGLGISNADINKIPVGIESRFKDNDTDGDGLADKLEDGLKTDSTKFDSDGDGISDGIEVLTNNTNPLGTGNLIYDSNLVNRLKGRILLQVESNGEAWYLNPKDGKKYYMKDGEAAYQIMRYLSLGITNNDLDNIAINPKYTLDGTSNDPRGYISKNIGNEITLSTLKFKLNSVSERDKIEKVAGGFIYPSIHNKFIELNVTVENITLKTFTQWFNGAYLIADNNMKYDVFIDIFNNEIGLKDLKPNIKETGIIVYEVPKNLFDYQMELQKKDTDEVYRYEIPIKKLGSNYKDLISNDNSTLYPINLINNPMWEIEITSGQSSIRVTRNTFDDNYLDSKLFYLEPATGVVQDQGSYLTYLKGDYLYLVSGEYCQYPNLHIDCHTTTYKIPAVINEKNTNGYKIEMGDHDLETYLYEYDKDFSVEIKKKYLTETSCIVRGVEKLSKKIYYTTDSDKILEISNFICFSSEQDAINSGFSKALDN